MLKLTCATKCSNIHMHPQIHSLNFTLTLAVLPGAAVSYLERGTATLEPRYCRNLRDRWGWVVLIPFPFLPNVSLLSLTHSARPRTEECPSLSPPLVTLSSQAFSLDSPMNPWEKKVPNSIREQILWFPNSKEHLVHVLAGGCVYYSWSFAPSRLEHHPWSLPTCVTAPGGL